MPCRTALKANHGIITQGEMARFAARPLRGSATKCQSAGSDREVALAQPQELRVAEGAQVLAHRYVTAVRAIGAVSILRQFEAHVAETLSFKLYQASVAQ